MGGRLYERTDDGTEFDWGRIIAWEPNQRLVFDWFLGADPDRASQVEVRFVGNDDGSTTVHLHHGRWEDVAAEIAEEHRACVAAPDGWTSILSGMQRDAARET